MVERFKDILKRTIAWSIVLSLMMTALQGCNSCESTFTVGLAAYPTSQTQIIEGFKAGMTELGYVEGQNIHYIYYSKSLGADSKLINDGIRKLITQDIDLLLTPFNETSIIAKEAVNGTDIPVLAVGCNRPVDIGFINALNDPGWNVTGVQFADTIAKGFELLKEVKSDIKKIYLPYNIDDMVSTLQLNELEMTASKMGIELVAQQVDSIEEAVSAVECLSKDFDAVYEFPSRALGPKSSNLTNAAIRRGIPTATGIPLDEEILITFASDPSAMGRQAARLADQILQGVNPCDLPFETSDTYLTINLKTADRIGVHVPDSLLVQAKDIIR